jgi:hypothetical protein
MGIIISVIFGEPKLRSFLFMQAAGGRVVEIAGEYAEFGFSRKQHNSWYTW